MAPPAVPEVRLSQSGRLPRGVLVAYGAPGAAYMTANIAISVWLMKFATDVLLIAPAAMGLLLLIARLWDAVSDPMAGYWSDRTRARVGRRRAWIGTAAPLAGAMLLLVWSPPAALSGAWVVLWVGAALLLWETASTGFYIPYSALGLELTGSHHERTRLFAWRHAISVIGYGTGIGVVYWIRSADSARDAALEAAIFCGLLLFGTTWAALPTLRERAAHQGRGAVRIGRAFRDVFANPHARILFVVFGVEMFGMGVVSTFAPYVMEDVVGRPDLLELLLASWMIPQFLFAPVWAPVSRRIGKKRLWLTGIALTSLGFAGQAFLDEGSWPVVFVLVFLIGIGGSIGNVLSPSVQADVVDYDELGSGERKEGAYVAVWNFVRKAGMALAAGIGGVALSAAGYDGEAEVQSELVRDTIRWVASVVPALLYGVAGMLLLRFSLDEAAHARIVAEIAARTEPPTRA